MRLLFASDLTEPVETVRQVEAFADGLQAELLVLHVISPAPVAPIDPMTGFVGLAPYTLYEPDVGASLEEAEEDAFRRFIATRFRRQIRPASRIGDAVDMILQDAEDERADVIVLGRRHRSKLERLLEGSVAGGVVRRATVPVILIPILDNAEGA